MREYALDIPRNYCDQGEVGLVFVTNISIGITIWSDQAILLYLNVLTLLGRAEMGLRSCFGGRKE